MGIGERIKAERIKRGLSQSELGRMLSLTRQAISSYENGRTEPDIEVIKNMAECFNVSIDYLINGTGQNEIEKRISKLGMTTAIIGIVFCLFMSGYGMRWLYLHTLIYFSDFKVTYFIHFVFMLIIGFISGKKLLESNISRSIPSLHIASYSMFIFILIMNIVSWLVVCFNNINNFSLLDWYWSVQYNNISLSILFYVLLGLVHGISG